VSSFFLDLVVAQSLLLGLSLESIVLSGGMADLKIGHYALPTHYRGGTIRDYGL
jgi:hypothetical protein